jgi:diguanylate cyclase (GGDEF)-like protein
MMALPERNDPQVGIEVHLGVLAEAVAGNEVASLALSAVTNYITRGDQEKVTDDLTGLPNRKALHARDAADALHALHSGDTSGAEQRQSAITGHLVYFVDLDKFKPINDEYGHNQGDRVLVLFGHIMHLSTRPEDELYRLGGDEFNIVMGLTGASEEVPSLRNELSSRFNAGVHFLLSEDGAEYLTQAGFGSLTALDREVVSDTLGWTIGEAYAKGPSVNREEALKAADWDMNRQKAAKGNVR